MGRSRANRTGRILRRADAPPQLHQAFVPETRAARRDQFFGQFPQRAFCGVLSNVIFDVKQACKDANHVAIQHGRIHPEGEAGDRTRRILADAGQPAQFVQAGREDRRIRPPPSARRGAGCAPDCNSSTLPQFHIIKRRCCQYSDGGKPFQKAFV
jgi:hypothetical protein